PFRYRITSDGVARTDLRHPANSYAVARFGRAGRYVQPPQDHASGAKLHVLGDEPTCYSCGCKADDARADVVLHVPNRLWWGNPPNQLASFAEGHCEEHR